MPPAQPARAATTMRRSGEVLDDTLAASLSDRVLVAQGVVSQ
jgi:hypothetical protein